MLEMAIPVATCHWEYPCQLMISSIHTPYKWTFNAFIKSQRKQLTLHNKPKIREKHGHRSIWPSPSLVKRIKSLIIDYWTYCIPSKSLILDCWTYCIPSKTEGALGLKV